MRTERILLSVTEHLCQPLAREVSVDLGHNRAGANTVGLRVRKNESVGVGQEYRDTFPGRLTRITGRSKHIRTMTMVQWHM